MAQETTQTVPDSRPRGAYVLPDGTEVAIIFDHGEHQPQSVTYQLGDGRVVNATKKNSFADHARLVKRDKLVAKIDAALVRDEINPVSRAAVHQVEDLTALGRAGFEMLAGVNAGSEATWHLVVDFYRSRLALHAKAANR